MFRIEYVDGFEVVSRPTLFVGDFQDFAERAGAGVRLVDFWARGFLPVGESPLIARNARSAPRPRSIQSRLFPYQHRLVRPRDGNQDRLVLPLVGFPQEGISFLSP